MKRNNMMADTKFQESETIARYACMLWENAGRPHGRDLEFWRQAEKLLRTAQQAEGRAVSAEYALVMQRRDSDRLEVPAPKSRQPKAVPHRPARSKTSRAKR
jgi:hypothetical protein